MRKRNILVSSSLNEEIKRIRDLILFYPNINFYHTAPYSSWRMPIEYGVRFGHLDTLKFIHVPYNFLFKFSINSGWLRGFEKAAKTRKSFCGLRFQ